MIKEGTAYISKDEGCVDVYGAIDLDETAESYEKIEPESKPLTDAVRTTGQKLLKQYVTKEPLSEFDGVAVEFGDEDCIGVTQAYEAKAHRDNHGMSSSINLQSRTI